MKKSWQTRSLGDLCDIVGGGTPPKDRPAFYDGEIPWATVRDMRQDVITETEFRITKDAVKSSATNIVPAGNVVIATRVGLGKVCLLGQDTAINQDLRGVVPRDKGFLDVRYLYWWLRSSADVIIAEGTGATVQGVKLPFVKSLQIPVPPLAEQQRIVSVLHEAFEFIATARANTERNLRNSQALLESHIQSVLTHRESGWVEAALGDLCGFVRGPFGGSLKKSIFVKDGYAVYEQQHAIYDQFEDVRYFIDEVKFKEMKRFELLPDDLIMSCSGTMGRVAIVPKNVKRGIINQALLKLTPGPKVLNTYLKYWMESKGFRDALNQYSGGAAIQNVASVKILKDIIVPLPSLSRQRRIVERLDAMRDEAERLTALYDRRLTALDAMKKALLRQAFTGQLRIADERSRN